MGKLVYYMLQSEILWIHIHILGNNSLLNQKASAKKICRLDLSITKQHFPCNVTPQSIQNLDTIQLKITQLNFFSRFLASSGKKAYCGPFGAIQQFSFKIDFSLVAKVAVGKDAVNLGVKLRIFNLAKVIWLVTHERSCSSRDSLYIIYEMNRNNTSISTTKMSIVRPQLAQVLCSTRLPCYTMLVFLVGTGLSAHVHLHLWFASSQLKIHKQQAVYQVYKLVELQLPQIDRPCSWK